MYFQYTFKNQIEYYNYFITLIRYVVLQDTSEYDKLNILFGIPQTELEYFFGCKTYMMKPRETKFFSRQKENLQLMNQKLQFRESIEFVDGIIKQYSGRERTEILQKIIHIIYRDISSDYTAGIFYKKHPPKRRLGFVPLPMFDEWRKPFKYEDFILSSSSTLDLSSDDVIINPMWRRESVKNCIDYLQKKPWKYSETNHLAYKYSIINIGYVYNGLHSSALGQIYKQGIIENVKVIDIGKLYKYIYTDGVSWYQIHDNTNLVEKYVIDDIRFPLIFEIGRRLTETNIL